MPKFLKDIDLSNNNLLNVSNIYTKAVLDTLLLTKANQTTTYTKAEEDVTHNLLAQKSTTINGHPLDSNITITAADVSLGNVTNAAQVLRTEMGVAGGVPTLDGTGKVPVSQLPSSIVGTLVYQGVWDATTNTPFIANATGVKGQYYKVSIAGSTTVDGNTNWTVGDLIVFDGTTWDKVEGGSPDVVSVAGRVGVITLTTSDVSPSTNRNYVTDSKLTVINNTSGTNTGDETLSTIKSKLGITVLSGSNTGDQTITLTGDVTGSGTGTFNTTLSNSSVSLNKIANITSFSILGNNTGSSSAPTSLTSTQVKSMLSIAESDVTNLTTSLSNRALLTSNTFTGKQSFVLPSTAYASINIPNGSVNPTAPVSGDMWANSTVLKWYNGTAIKNIAFLDSNITGNASNVTGIVSIANGGTGQSSSTLARSALGATGKYTSNIGIGTNNTVTHGLNTLDVIISVYEISTNTQAYPDVVIIDSNNISVNFATAPGANTYKVVIIG